MADELERIGKVVGGLVEGGVQPQKNEGRGVLAGSEQGQSGSAADVPLKPPRTLPSPPLRNERPSESQRVNELLVEHDIMDADALKHTLEDHDRWERDVVALDVENGDLRAKIAILEARVESGAQPEPRPDARERFRSAAKLYAESHTLGEWAQPLMVEMLADFAAINCGDSQSGVQALSEPDELRRKQLDAEQAWEYLQSKNVPNLDIERPGQSKVTLTELLAEFANGVLLGRVESGVQPDPDLQWNPDVEIYRKLLMEQFADKCSMEQIASASYILAGSPPAPSRKIEFEREDDGRWIADITDTPGAMAYSKTPHEALDAALKIAGERGTKHE